MSKAKSVLPSAGDARGPEWHWRDTEFETRFPSLYEFLAKAKLDQEPRKGGSIALFCSSGKLRVSFLDKQTNMAFYADLEGTDPLLMELETILAGDHEAWHQQKKDSTKVPF